MSVNSKRTCTRRDSLEFDTQHVRLGFICTAINRKQSPDQFALHGSAFRHIHISNANREVLRSCNSSFPVEYETRWGTAAVASTHRHLQQGDKPAVVVALIPDSRPRYNDTWLVIDKVMVISIYDYRLIKAVCDNWVSNWSRFFLSSVATCSEKI